MKPTLISGSLGSRSVPLCSQVILLAGGTPEKVQVRESVPIIMGTSTSSSVPGSTSGATDGEREREREKQCVCVCEGGREEQKKCGEMCNAVSDVCCLVYVLIIYIWPNVVCTCVCLCVQKMHQ